MLVLIALAFISFIALSLIALITAGIAHRTHKENILQTFFALLVEKWRIVVGALGAIVGLFVLYMVISISNQPPAPCTPGLSPVSQKPSVLVTAQDYFAQGDYEYERGACNAAIAAYTRAIEIDPKFAEAYNNRAYTYMVQHNYAEALPDLNKAIELRPDYVNALMNRGDIYNYYYEINYDRAVADYDRILQIGGREHNTSVCGHRLLAEHRGWDLGVFVEVFFTKGFDAGCN